MVGAGRDRLGRSSPELAYLRQVDAEQAQLALREARWRWRRVWRLWAGAAAVLYVAALIVSRLT